jgi:hypothetical protein
MQAIKALADMLPDSSEHKKTAAAIRARLS